MKKLKRSTIFIVLALAALCAITVYAISQYFKQGNEYTSNVGKKTYFEFTDVDPFTGSVDLGPGEAMSVYPCITSTASVDMYPFVVFKMPIISTAEGDAGLYEIEAGSGWSECDSYESDGVWVKAFSYGSLSAGANTGEAAWTVTMADISKADYGNLEDLNYSITGYAIGTDEEEFDDAWNDVEAHFGL